MSDGPADTPPGPADREGADRGPAEQGRVDRSSADPSSADLTSQDRGSADRGSADRGPDERGWAHEGPADPGWARRGWGARLREWWGAEEVRTPRERARRSAIRRGVAAGMVVIVAGSMVRLPFLVLSPGPTYNTIGEVAGQPLIVVEGTTTYPTEGSLDMTTVSERGGASNGVYLGEAMLGWALPDSSVIPRESLYGDIPGQDVKEANDQLFALSQSDSIAAALGELGIPTEQSVVVTVVGGGSPADGIVEAGDEVVAVDGRPVDDPADVGRLVRRHDVGDTVELTVLRTDEDGQSREEVLRVVAGETPQELQADPGQGPQAYLGIAVGTRHEAPFDITFSLDNVGGPSAGMMFSLAIVDMLTEGPLTGGGHVAGTGTIDADGQVGPIGGIAHKLVGARDAGATLFLAPVDNCDEVAGHEPDGLRVVAVGTLSEARDAVEAWAADPQVDLPSCSTGRVALGR